MKSRRSFSNACLGPLLFCRNARGDPSVIWISALPSSSYQGIWSHVLFIVSLSSAVKTPRLLCILTFGHNLIWRLPESHYLRYTFDLDLLGEAYACFDCISTMETQWRSNYRSILLRWKAILKTVQPPVDMLNWALRSAPSRSGKYARYFPWC